MTLDPGKHHATLATRSQDQDECRLSISRRLLSPRYGGEVVLV